jgi:hypothetical protein
VGKVSRNKAKGADNPKLLPTEDLDQRAKSDLAKQNYRRAKEWLKELCKRDNEQYLPQLIQCYQEMAKRMLENGQPAEAKTVLDRIRLLAGDNVAPLLEAQLATQSADYVAAAGTFVEHCIAGGNFSNPGDDRVMADAFVLAFEDHSDLKEGNPKLYGELMAVIKALEYVCEERFADASSELKKIGLHSRFSNWRIFVKGLCAFYTGADSRAREAFMRLTDEPLLQKASRPFLFILGEQSASPSKGEAKEPLLMQVCTLLNSKDLEHVLPRAEYLWQLKRYNDSYEHVAKTLPGFPSEEPGLLRTLTRFYYNALFKMSYQQTEKYIKSISYIADKKKKNHLDHLIFARVRNLYLDMEEAVPDHEMMKLWDEYLLLYDLVYGENARLRAIVYAYLGDKFSMEEEPDPFQSMYERRKNRPGIRNFRLAEESYNHSLRLNSADKEVHLSQLRLYEKTGENSKKNKKLDEIIRRFPDDKETLIKNGHSCIERKAFIKGIEYLKRAVILDPLDRHIKEDLCLAYVKASYHFAGKCEAGRYREFMGEAMRFGEAGLGNINVGLPYLKVRLAIFEWIGDCSHEGDLLLEDVLCNGDGRAQLTFFAYLMSRIYEAPAQCCSRLETRVIEVFNKPDPGVAASCIDILQYITLIDRPNFWIRKELNRLNEYVMDASVKACPLPEAEKIVRYALTHGTYGKRIAGKYIRRILEKDSRNPLFLYFEYLTEKMDECHSPTDSDLQRVKDILTIAVERNDRLLINDLNKAINSIQDFLSLAIENDWDAADDDGDDWDGDMNEKFEIGRLYEEIKKILKPGSGSSSQKKKARNILNQPSFFDDCPF